ncbi:MAG: terminase small subunit [Patescibacteria group bacterium]
MATLSQNKLAKSGDYLTTKELIFVNEYIVSGNATQAYIKAFNVPKSRYHSATVLASRLKQKIHNLDKLYFENAGLNARLISTVIKQAMKAKKQVIYKGIHDYPDHTTRLKAVEVYDKLVNKEENKQNTPTMMTGLQIIIQK